MAFTRKYLAGLGLDADKIEAIMDAHVEVVDGLKARIAENNDSADELAKVKDELAQAKNDLKTAQDKIEAAEKDDYKAKYESEKAAHQKLQSDIAAEKTAAKQETTLKAAAKKAKYSADAIALILDSKKDYAGRVEFDENGNATNIDAVLADIAADRPELAPKAKETHHNPATPPEGSGVKTKMTKSEIMAIKDDTERQRAIKENLDVFGISDDTAD